MDNFNYDDNMFNSINGILLTNKEMNVLDKYNISYMNCKNMEILIYMVEDYLNNSTSCVSDLEEVSLNLSERNYYLNTNK